MMGDVYARKRILEMKEKRTRRESRNVLLFFSVVSFLFGMLFWTNNITGNVILSGGSSRFFGVGVLFIVLSIVGFYFYLKT